jgi:hypothetical protein
MIANIAIASGKKRQLSTLRRIFLELEGKRIVGFSCIK